MAKIKMAHIIAEARGKVGGTVFSRNTFGAYIRTRVTPVNPSSVAQQLVRTQLTGIAQRWRGLTQDQRNAWNQGAVNFQHTDIFGDNVPLTGFSLFMQLNRNQAVISAADIDDIPTPSDVFGFTSNAITANTTGGVLTLDFAPAITAGTQIAVYATPGQSPGKKFVKSEFRQIAVLDNADLTGFDLAAAYIVVFGALPSIGSKVFVETRPITNTTGQSGIRLKSEDIAI